MEPYTGSYSKGDQTTPWTTYPLHTQPEIWNTSHPYSYPRCTISLEYNLVPSRMVWGGNTDGSGALQLCRGTHFDIERVSF